MPTALTTKTKVGLVLAILLGLSDIAILIPFMGDGADKPPAVIVVLTVIVGVITIVAAARAWTAPTRSLFLAVFVTRVISALGDLGGIFAGGAVAVGSAVLLVISLVCLWLLLPTIKNE